jgi:hypothetical protein
MIDLISTTIDSTGLIGSAIDSTTPVRVLSIIDGVLAQCVSTDLIVDYSSPQVRQTGGDPTVIEAKFQYLPAYPLNYILLLF